MNQDDVPLEMLLLGEGISANLAFEVTRPVRVIPTGRRVADDPSRARTVDHGRRPRQNGRRTPKLGCGERLAGARGRTAFGGMIRPRRHGRAGFKQELNSHLERGRHGCKTVEA